MAQKDNGTSSAKHEKARFRARLLAEGSKAVTANPEDIEKVNEQEDEAQEFVSEAFPHWLVYNILLAHRQHDENGPRPIPLLEIIRVCELEQFSDADIRWFIDVFAYLDTIYVKHAHERITELREEAKRKAEREAARRS
jgi:hypothetical protein